MPVIDVKNLRKAYGATVAVDDVSFSVERGEIFGILGRNGAGKTTTVECIVGLRRPDGGAIRVLGLDPQSGRRELREHVGVQLQESALPAKLKVREAIDLYASFYRRPVESRDLTQALGLGDKLDSYYGKLSGGQKRRLSIALALIGDPEVAVLDELTTGLDPQARRGTWQVIEGIRDRGVTVMLVTHFMDEAERLCDRVALIDAGRIVAIDSPEGMGRRVRGGKLVRFVPSGPFDERILTEVKEVRGVVHDGDHLVVHGSGELVNVIVLALDRVGVVARDVQLGSASLEDAFLELTGSAPGSAPEPARDGASSNVADHTGRRQRE
ncbi:MAG: ABC transporter ATP-binding protein [Trueperaceae bacterium]